MTIEVTSLIQMVVIMISISLISFRSRETKISALSLAKTGAVISKMYKSIFLQIPIIPSLQHANREIQICSIFPLRCSQ